MIRGTDDVEDIYRLSPLQQGLLFHSLDVQATTYLGQLSFLLHGELEAELLERAWRRVVERHPALRTSFHWEELDEPIQVVHRCVELPFIRHDWSELPEVTQNERLEAITDQERRLGLDVREPPLMRLHLVRLGPLRHWMVWTVHHLLIDGWSFGLVLKEIWSAYQAFADGHEFVAEQPVPYREYIAWLECQDRVAAEAYWRKCLAGVRVLAPHGGSSEKDALEGSAGEGRDEVVVSAPLTAALGALARRHRFTLNTLIQGAWAIVLSRWSGEEDIVFGATVSGRPADLPGAEAIVGLLINALPVRTRVEARRPVLEWLAELQARQAEQRQYEYSSLVDIQGWSEVPRGRELFETLLVCENYPLDPTWKGIPGRLELRDLRTLERTNYPLALIVSFGAELHVGARFHKDRLDRGAVRRYLQHLTELLTEMATNPHRRVGALAMVGEAERHVLLLEWGGGAPGEGGCEAGRASIHERFEAQAQVRPDAIAVIAGESSLSYGALNKRANRIAGVLREWGVGPETRVGVCVRRGGDLVAALLGVLKSGGAYVPLDPEYPGERLRYLVEDSGAEVVVAESGTVARLGGASRRGGRVLLLDVEGKRLSRQPESDVASGAGPSNVAYLIYTSGSTGRPKGVAIEHKSAAGLVEWAMGRYASEDLAGVLAATSICFDLSVFELFVPLATGHLVVMAEDAVTLPSAWGAVTLVNTVPSAMAELVRRRGVLGRVRVVNLAGEVLTRSLAEGVYGQGVGEVLNLYAPSETTTYSTCSRVEPGAKGAPRIGRPIGGASVQVLDAAGALAGVGMAGEMYIGGIGVARGYQERPELTAERFVPDPHGEAGTRRYRTGDLARWNGNGELEFLGRVDTQVKVRGYRIELGEIEAALQEHEAVREAVVFTRMDVPGDTSVVAYVVMQGSASTLDLRRFLLSRLPEFMVPSNIVLVESLSRTPNGKIDRLALRGHRRDGIVASERGAPPLTPTERLIAEIWQEVLEIDEISVQDNFFDLGGHSLQSIIVIDRIEKKLNLRISRRELFLQTLGQFAASCDVSRRATTRPPARTS